MAKSRSSRRILWYQAFGFLVIIALSWLDELISLPTLLFGGAASSNWRESALESIVALAVWLPLFFLTRRLLARLHYLEEFLRVCAWCRRIGQDERWMPIEEYFTKGLEVKTSHSICPDCAEQHFPKAPNDV